MNNVNKTDLETAILQLKCMLSMACAAGESENITSYELSIALKPVAELAEKIYCVVADSDNNIREMTV